MLNNAAESANESGYAEGRKKLRHETTYLTGD